MGVQPRTARGETPLLHLSYEFAVRNEGELFDYFSEILGRCELKQCHKKRRSIGDFAFGKSETQIAPLLFVSFLLSSQGGRQRCLQFCEVAKFL